MKKLLAVVLIVVLMISVAACAGQPEGTQGEPAGQTEAAGTESAAPANEGQQEGAKDKYVIGVSIGNLENEANAVYTDAMRARAAELGNVELLVTDGAGEAEKQVTQCETFVTQGVDAVILMPYDAQGCMPAVEACVEAGVPIITSKVEVSDQSVASGYVGANDLDGGVMETEYICELLGGKGNVVVMEGPTGQSASMLRMEGTQKVLEKYPDVKMIYNQPGNWLREEGMALMENWLQLGDEIDAVIAHNDEMALGAYDAVVDAGLQDKIHVIGIDAIDAAMMSVKEGGLVATVRQETEQIAAKALDVALELAKGNAVESEVYIPFTLIDSSNVDQFVK